MRLLSNYYFSPFSNQQFLQQFHDFFHENRSLFSQIDYNPHLFPFSICHPKYSCHTCQSLVMGRYKTEKLLSSSRTWVLIMAYCALYIHQSERPQQDPDKKMSVILCSYEDYTCKLIPTSFQTVIRVLHSNYYLNLVTQ